MFCQRCRGLLVLETFGDLRQETASICPATRCINCGCVEDSVVRANRHHTPVAQPSAHQGMTALKARFHSA